MKKWILPTAAVAAGIIAAGAFILGGGDGLPMGADPANSHQVAIGKTVYAENCASCHGVNLEGQKNWQTPLQTGGLPAPPHDETGHTWHHPDAVLFNYTKRGGQKLVPASFKSNMPGFEGSLTDGEIWAVLAYIKSEWPVKIRRRHAQMSQSR